MFSTKSRISNISINSSSFNLFSSSFYRLLQIAEKTNAFSKLHDILDFSKFVYYRKQRNIVIILIFFDIEKV